MAWNAVGSLVFLGCQWLTCVLTARLADDYATAGALALAMSISNVFATIALYKTRSYQVSDIHERTSSGQYIGLRFATLAIAWAAGTAYTLATCPADSWGAVLAYGAYRSIDLFIDVLHGIDQQRGRMDICGTSMALRGVASVTAFTTAFAATGGLEIAIVAMTAANLPILVFDLKMAGTLSDVRPVLEAASIRRLLLECLPSVGGAAAAALAASLPRQYLGHTLGEEALGVYSTVCTPVVLIQACASYIYAPMLGAFANLLDARDSTGFAKLLGKTVALLAFAFALCATGFAMFGEDLLRTAFGAEIARYGWLMYAGIACAALTALMGFGSDLLIVLRDMRGALFVNLVGLGVSLLSTPVLVVGFGMNGVSLAVAAANLAGTVAAATRVLKGIKGEEALGRASFPGWRPLGEGKG